METICIKIEDNLLGRINQDMEERGYTTKTEFIREAIRKKLEDDEREKLIKEFLKFKGKSPRKTTDEERAKTREKVFLEMAKEKGWKI
jgi:Arc/MetJ-type ribon-helix-helix transcriptional regulator